MMEEREPAAPLLPQSCERALLERFLKAEAMAMWSVRSAQAQDVPAHVLRFLRRHEEDEERHLRQFEALLGTQAWDKVALPQVPRQWSALAVQLYGYEALGLEFAKLLASVRTDLSSILADEEIHVAFFERELQAMLRQGQGPAQFAREFARSWWRRLPRTIDRYLNYESLAPFRAPLRLALLTAIKSRFTTIGLLDHDDSASWPPSQRAAARR